MGFLKLSFYLPRFASFGTQDRGYFEFLLSFSDHPSKYRAISLLLNFGHRQ